MTTSTPRDSDGASSQTEWGTQRLDVTAYLERIGYVGELTPTGETLRALHRRHIGAIPFENLDVVLGRAITLDIDRLQDKLVRRPRGGYCHEHNLLFAAVLERLGYRVTRLAARIRNGSDNIRPRTHTLLRVETEGARWLADVGFGGGVLEPIPFEVATPAHQEGWTYRLEREADGTWLLRALRADGWFDLYTFTLESQRQVDVVLHNHYAATHPDSPFVGRPVVMRTEPHAHLALVGTTMTTSRPDGTATRRDVTEEGFTEVLQTVFGISLEAQEAARLLAESDTDKNS